MTNNDRPADFDAQLKKSLGLIRYFAARNSKNDVERDELAQDIALRAIEKWENFREEGSFAQWLKFLTWQIVTLRKAAKGLRFVSGHDGAWDRASVSAGQEDTVDAARALEAAQASPLLSRLAQGDKASEIARELGVHRNSVTQMAARHRVKYLGAQMRAAA